MRAFCLFICFAFYQSDALSIFNNFLSVILLLFKLSFPKCGLHSSAGRVKDLESYV